MALKINTITCHEVYNHGAVLQEYALIEYLKTQGYDASAIHYKPDYLSGHFKLWTVSQRWQSNFVTKWIYLFLKLPKRIYILRRKREFDKFSAKYLQVDNQLYKSNDELKANLPNADVFICGSDQIWNSYFQNGKDPAFYLDFVPNDKKKISYAASFAIDQLEENIKPFVKEKVQKINHISVRETSGKRILEELGIQNVTQVLDPVFLIDESHWKQNFVTNRTDDYIFIYDFDSNPIIQKIATELSKKWSCKIYTVNDNIKYADNNFYLEGPKTFLSLMYNAKYVITNSFHSVAFSLIFNKQFLVVNRTEAINTRMRDLLGLFNLSNLLVSSEFTISDIKTINFEEANRLKIEAIEKSKAFLSNVIN
jgi:hypothetical protein